MVTSYHIQRLNPVTGEWFDYTVPFRCYLQAAEHMSNLRKDDRHAKYHLVRRTVEEKTFSA